MGTAAEILVTGATVTAETASEDKGEMIGSNEGRVMIDDGSSALFAAFCDDIKTGNTTPDCNVKVGAEACVPILMANRSMFNEEYISWDMNDYL